jgi:hypothetical protein
VGDAQVAWSLAYTGDAQTFRWDEHPVMGAPGRDAGADGAWRSVQRQHDGQVEMARTLAERAVSDLHGPVELSVHGSLAAQERDPDARDVLSITVRSRPTG